MYGTKCSGISERTFYQINLQHRVIKNPTGIGGSDRDAAGSGESDEERVCKAVLGECVAKSLHNGEHSTKLDAYNDCCINMMHADHDCCKLY